jgi:hypothetical protein
LNQHLINTGPRNLGLAQHFYPRHQSRRHVLKPNWALPFAERARKSTNIVWNRNLWPE